MARLQLGKIIGYILIVVLVMYCLSMYFKEGFETMLTSANLDKPPHEMCPVGNAIIIQMVKMGNTPKDTIMNSACYREGITNANSVFKGDNQFITMIAPKGYTVTLYSDKDGKGSIVSKLSDVSENNDCMDKDVNKKFNCISGMMKISNLTNAKFSSIKVSSGNSSKPSYPRDPDDYRDGRYPRDQDYHRDRRYPRDQYDHRDRGYPRDQYDHRDRRYSRDQYDHRDIQYSRQPYKNRDTIASIEYSNDEDEDEDCE